MTLTKIKRTGGRRTARHARGLVIALVLVLAPHGPAHALELDENQALALFYARNLDLIAAHYEVDRSRAREIIAAALPNPVLNVGTSELDATRNAGNNGEGPAAGFSVSQLIETAGKRRLRIASSALGTKAAEETLRDTTRQLTAGVRHAFYALMLAQQTLAVAEATCAHYAELVRLHELRLAHGDIPQADLWRLKVEQLKAESNRDTAQAALAKARTDLASLLRFPDGADELRARGDYPAASDFGGSTIDALMATALEQRPDLRAARVQAEQAATDLALARRQVIPDVTLSAGYSHDPNNTNTETANVGVSVQVPLFYRNAGEIRQAQIAVDANALALQQVEQRLRADIGTALAAWQRADAVARRFETEIVGQVGAVRDAAELSYGKGQTGILDLIDAQRNYREVMLEFQNVLYDRAVAAADLRAAIGAEENQP